MPKLHFAFGSLILRIKVVSAALARLLKRTTVVPTKVSYYNLHQANYCLYFFNILFTLLTFEIVTARRLTRDKRSLGIDVT
jgi:hypothetical protein